MEIINSCMAETGLFRYHKVNTMVFDALAPFLAKSSANMVSIMHDR